MTDTNRSALRRKLSSGSTTLSSAPRSVMRALRLALARSADEKLKLPLTVIGAKQAVRTTEELAEVFLDDWLLLQFSGQCGTTALGLNPGCVSAIVQMQTLSQVLPDAPQARGFTDTDAAMAAPMFEDCFARARGLVEAMADIDLLSGIEFSFRAEDGRALSLGLTEDSYRVFDLTVELAGGIRQGRVLVALPELAVPALDQAEPGPPSGPTLGAAAGVIRADLQTIICRMNVPLSDLSNWDLGDIVPLPGTRLDRAEVTTIDRTRAGVGRLGQCGGMRAVRINEQGLTPVIANAVQPEFTEASAIDTNGDVRIADTNLSPISSLGNTLSTIGGAPPDTVGHDPEPLPSDRIVDEISQLAGLTGPDDLMDQS